MSAQTARELLGDLTLLPSLEQPSLGAVAPSSGAATHHWAYDDFPNTPATVAMAPVAASYPGGLCSSGQPSTLQPHHFYESTLSLFLQAGCCR